MACTVYVCMYLSHHTGGGGFGVLLYFYLHFLQMSAVYAQRTKKSFQGGCCIRTGPYRKSFKVLENTFIVGQQQQTALSLFNGASLVSNFFWRPQNRPPFRIVPVSFGSGAIERSGLRSAGLIARLSSTSAVYFEVLHYVV